MSKLPLSYIEINPKTKPVASIICLHGLGSSGHDSAGIVNELNLPEDLAIRFIFPHAPLMPVTLNNGYEMPAWFDVLELKVNPREDEQGLKQSAEKINSFIQTELSLGIPSNKIIVAGFSQGGALAIFTALRFPQTLAGVLALSSFVPAPQSLARESSPANKKTPIFMAHGDSDPIIPHQWGEMSRDYLLASNHQVDWRLYPMAHAVCHDEIRDMSHWIQKVLS
jgi:phospholipase/carboxylesterase